MDGGEFGGVVVVRGVERAVVRAVGGSVGEVEVVDVVRDGVGEGGVGGVRGGRGAGCEVEATEIDEGDVAGTSEVRPAGGKGVVGVVERGVGTVQDVVDHVVVRVFLVVVGVCVDYAADTKDVSGGVVGKGGSGG